MTVIDLPAGPATPVVIGIGEEYEGTLEVRGDRDWIRIDLTAGQTIQVTLEGFGDNPLGDPTLGIYDSDNNLLEFNDDFDVGRNSGLTFTAQSTAAFYIEAAGYDDVERGDYRIVVGTGVPLTDPTNAIDWNTQVADPEVKVYFGAAGFTRGGYTSEGFNAYEIAQFEKAFAAIAAVADVTFTIVNRPQQADFKLVLDTNEVNGEFLGVFGPPGERGAGVGVFDGAGWDRTAGGDLESGGYGFVTIVHELLHGMGLAHPHDTGGGSDTMPGVTSEFDDFGDAGLNQGIFTIMSYNSGYMTGTPGSAGPEDGGFGYEAGPMALDIAVLQEKYGANTTTNAGGTTYVLSNENAPGSKWVSIWDAGGIDTIRHDGNGRAVIDLRDATLGYEDGGGGFVSARNGVAGGFTIAHGVVIERAFGGGGWDHITGNDSDNTLKGNNGADLLEGLAGNDRIAGNAGDDQILGGAGGDMLIGGIGDDVFLFQSFRDSRGNGAQRDTITDFTQDADKIDLSQIDANGRLGGDGQFVFIGRLEFSGEGATSAGELRFDRGSEGLVLQADVNGDGRADLRIFMEDLNRVETSDFLLT